MYFYLFSGHFVLHQSIVSTLRVLQQRMVSIQQRQEEEAERQHKKDERQLKEMASLKETQDCILRKLESIATSTSRPGSLSLDTPTAIDDDLQSILSSFQDEPSIYEFDHPPSDSTVQSPITSPSSSFFHRLASPSPSFPINRPVRFYSPPPSHSHPPSLPQTHFSPPPRFPAYA